MPCTAACNATFAYRTSEVRMRTTNGVERLHKEIKRRTRVASFFPNGFQGQGQYLPLRSCAPE